ncbi:MAG: hypothetical protein HZB16_18965 [Armatimonadetes bacterium]|nr:hypothetical protein [Armatimonadota bacterium]
MRRIAAVFVCWLVVAPPLGAAITVANHRADETLRYPVVLLTGRADSGDVVTITNADNPRPDGRNQGPVIDRMFKLLVELRGGINHLTLAAGGEKLDLALEYRPMVTDYKVRLVYLTGSEKATAYPTPNADDPQNYQARLRTAARLMQTFCAEAMTAQGFGPLTFDLACDTQGDPIVDTVAYPEAAADLRARDAGEQWQRTYQLLGRSYAFSRTKVLCANAFIAYDPATKRALGHTALGGGSLAVFSTNPLYAWPANLRDVQRAFDDATRVDTAKVCDDTAYRGTNWAMAATGIGAWLHELGHTFGLPHSPDPRCIMSRGFDMFNRAFVLREAPTTRRAEPLAFKSEQTAYWDPLFAERLSLNPFWQPDGPKASGQAEPRAKYDWATRRLTITAPAGLAAVQVEGPQMRTSLAKAQLAGKRELVLASADLRVALEAPDGVNVIAFDRDGRSVSFDERTARDPRLFVRTWQLAAAPQAWTAMPKAPTLDDTALATIIESLRTRPATPAKLPDADQALSLDLAATYADNQTRVAYALTTVRVDEERKVKLLAGGDDGFRIWLNGALVLDRTGVQVVATDSATAEVTLKAGANTLLVESQQGGGGWNFALRLTTPDGKPLLLTTEGKLRNAGL